MAALSQVSFIRGTEHCNCCTNMRKDLGGEIKQPGTGMSKSQLKAGNDSIPDRRVLPTPPHGPNREGVRGRLNRVSLHVWAHGRTAFRAGVPEPLHMFMHGLLDQIFCHKVRGIALPVDFINFKDSGVHLKL